MSSFVLKIIACITMLMDHVGYAILGHTSWLNYWGRIAFPLFAFQLTQGYAHTKNIKKYFSRLFLFALISQIPFAFFYTPLFHDFKLNIFFTLLLGLFSIFAYDKNKLAGFFTLIVTCCIAHFGQTDYGYFGVLVIFVFHLCKDHKLGLIFSFLLLDLIKYAPAMFHSYSPTTFAFFLFTAASLIPILFYNKKQGRKMKYFFYLFYPIHLAIIDLLMYLLP